MDSEFITIQEVSEYLHIKPATLYAKVGAGDLPHYKVGRLVRFKREDIDQWMETHRRDPSYANTTVKAILKATNKKVVDVDSIVKRAIEEVKGNVYTPKQGEPN